MRLLAGLVGIGLAGSASAGEVPRLTGMVIAPGQRTALFEAGGVTIPAEVGETVGGLRVVAIGAEGVKVAGRDETLLLHPSGVAVTPAPVDAGGATFGLMLRHQPPPDD